MEKITIQEFARRVGISKDTAYYWNKRGLIPLDKVKVGRQTYLFWDAEKIAGSLVSMNDDVRQELLRMRHIFQTQVKRIDILLKSLIKADLVHAKRLVKVKRK